MNALKQMIKDLLSGFLSGPALDFFSSVAVILLWMLVGIIIIKVLNRVLMSVFKIRKNDRRTITVGRLIRSLTKVLVWFIVIAIILSELGVDIAPLIASAGILGVALGFGAQSMVKDFIAGFFFVMERAFYVDDVVEINGFKGKVTYMGLRTTSLMNWMGQVKIVNNGDISNLINFSKSESVAVVDFGVHYNTDLKKLAEVMPQFLAELEQKYDKIVETPKFLGVTELAASSINLRIIAKTLSNEQFQIERDIRRDLVEFLNNNNVIIPFPQVVVHNA